MTRLFEDIDTGATFSECGAYRYRLWRIWDETLPVVNFILLNPSTADATKNDPTVERCQRRASMWNYGGLVVTNLFAFRATDPEKMKAAPDPVGPENDSHLVLEADRCGLIVCGWGVLGTHRRRSEFVVKDLLAPFRLHCLFQSKNGEPCHPLYLAYDLKPKPMA